MRNSQTKWLVLGMASLMGFQSILASAVELDLREVPAGIPVSPALSEAIASNRRDYVVAQHEIDAFRGSRDGQRERIRKAEFLAGTSIDPVIEQGRLLDHKQRASLRSIEEMRTTLAKTEAFLARAEAQLIEFRATNNRLVDAAVRAHSAVQTSGSAQQHTHEDVVITAQAAR